jgi:predicted ArsR family transcriptional regulator
MTERSPAPGPIQQVALLGDAVRRAAYEVVAAAAEPVDRDAVAAAAHISRQLAAFHLDRLVRGGLLEATYRRRTGRTGPGAGRPAKFYRRAAEKTIDVSLPERTYDVAAEVFATALERVRGGAGAVRSAATEAGHAAGRAVPAPRRASRRQARAALLAVMAGRGFEPRQLRDGGVELGNCPFRDLTGAHRDLTCGANLALVSALVEDFPAAGLLAERKDPAEPCCVRLIPGRDGAGPVDPRRARTSSE